MSDVVIFISGSISIRSLPPEVTCRLDTIILNDYLVVIGDAPGVDTLVQSYLFSKNYPNVTVHHSGQYCRNNVGCWITQGHYINGYRGRAFYTIKDVAMADIATHGFVIWDGVSKGSKNNINNLKQQNKPVLVYYSDLNKCIWE